MEMVDLKKSQWWPRKRLEEFQNERLRKIVKYAYENIRGYRIKFDRAKVKPKDIRSKEDLWKIPITTREELQNNVDFVNKRLISRALFTGGSTGAPLKYYESAESTVIRWDSHIRGWSWSGYAPGHRIAVISSARCFSLLKNTLNIPGDLTIKKLERNIKELRKFKPEYIRGYVSSLYFLARYCLDNKIKLKGIVSAIPSSENLYDFQRKIIERAFGCDVFEEYCCNDGGACAWECEEHTGLHYFMERSVIEEVGGKMVVTDLWNRAMPFIRYENGDSVRFLGKKCPCGRSLPLIKVRGRDNDIIITKKGVMSPNFLIYGVGYGKKNDCRNGVHAIQYIQKPGYILEINIVKNRWCSAEEIKNFKKDLTKFIDGLKPVVNIVGDIPATKKGKRAFIINEDKDLLKKARL